jgi:hypothetical protein
MGTNTNIKASKHQGGFSCRVAPVLDEDVFEEQHQSAQMEVAAFLCGAAFTTAGVIAVSEAFRSGLPLVS